MVMKRICWIVGSLFWRLYQFVGRNSAPAFTLDLFDGLAEHFLDGETLVYCIYHCWHCPNHLKCEYESGLFGLPVKRGKSR